MQTPFTIIARVRKDSDRKKIQNKINHFHPLCAILSFIKHVAVLSCQVQFTFSKLPLKGLAVMKDHL